MTNRNQSGFDHTNEIEKGEAYFRQPAMAANREDDLLLRIFTMEENDPLSHSAHVFFVDSSNPGNEPTRINFHNDLSFSGECISPGSLRGQ